MGKRTSRGGKSTVDEGTLQRLLGGFSNAAKDTVEGELGVGGEEEEGALVDELADAVIRRFVQLTFDNPAFMMPFKEFLGLAANNTGTPDQLMACCLQMTKAATPPEIDAETLQTIKDLETAGRYQAADRLRATMVATGASASFTAIAASQVQPSTTPWGGDGGAGQPAGGNPWTTGAPQQQQSGGQQQQQRPANPWGQGGGSSQGKS